MLEILRFSEHLVMAAFGYTYGLSVADIAGNGHADLIAADTDVGLYWFEKDGRGTFTHHIIHQRRGEWLERHAVADINANTVVIADLDGDGHLDIVAATVRGSNEVRRWCNEGAAQG